MDQRFADQCIRAQQRAMLAARRLEAANTELHLAEVEHRLANEELDRAEALYYRQPDSAGATHDR